MKIYLYLTEKIVSFTLPQEIMGSYSFDEDPEEEIKLITKAYEFAKEKHEGQLRSAKVTNTGLLHHKDGTISEMLYLKYSHCSGSWLRTASDCELITTMEVK